MTKKALSDEEFADLKATVAEEETRRQDVAREEHDAFMKPIQDLANGKGMDTVLEKLEAILADPKAGSDRNLRMALDALRGSIENLRMTVPNTRGPTPAMPQPTP